MCLLASYGRLYEVRSGGCNNFCIGELLLDCLDFSDFGTNSPFVSMLLLIMDIIKNNKGHSELCYEGHVSHV